MRSTEITGTDLLRQAVRSRNSKLNLAIFGRDLQLTGDQVHAFIFNKVDLTPDQKRSLANYLWAGHTAWDETTDRLMPAKPQIAKSQGLLPQFDPRLLPKYRAGPAPPRPVKDRPQVKPETRPGWLSGFG